LTCRELVRRLCEYLDGELDPALAQALTRHLEHCEDCHLVVDTTRKTIEVYCKTEPSPLPSAVRERLDQALAEKFRRAS
jgi:anti-sigma factor RsiW